MWGRSSDFNTQKGTKDEAARETDQTQTSPNLHVHVLSLCRLRKCLLHGYIFVIATPDDSNHVRIYGTRAGFQRFLNRHVLTIPVDDVSRAVIS